MIWYLENPLRFRLEREHLEHLAGTADWLHLGEWRTDASLKLCLDADVIAGDRRHPLTLSYPSHFPHSPPTVVPRGDTSRWSSHQYGAGGELCLEYGPDNWHPDVTGATMIESAHRLLQGELPTADAPALVASRHATTLGQDLRGDAFRFLVTRPFDEFLRKMPEQAVVFGKVLVVYHDGTIVSVVQSATLEEGGEWRDATVPQPFAHEALAQDLAIVRLAASAAVPTTRSAAELRLALGVDATIAQLIIARGAQIVSRRLWSDDTITDNSIIPPAAPRQRLQGDHAALLQVKVALIGCGSLGSKIAVMLARAGVGKFLLVDDDLLLPDNMVRHDLDWRDIGSHKAQALSRRIQLVNPNAECTVRQHRLGGQEASGSIESLIGTLAASDLIVEATADPRVFGYASAAAATGSTALLWAEVFGGGFGGLIARHRPSLEPDPASMRRAIEGWSAAQGIPVERAADYTTLGGAAAPLIADDADVSAIAAPAARLAIDTLLQRTPSMFPYSAYMIGLSKGWIFEQPFDTRPIDVGPAMPAPATGGEDAEAIAEEMARLLQMLAK